MRWVFDTSLQPSWVKGAIRKMRWGKATGPNVILVKVWKSTCKIGMEWLIELFDVSFRTTKRIEK